MIWAELTAASVMIFGDKVDQLLDHGKQRAFQVVPGAHLVQDHLPSCGQVGLVPVRQPQGGADPVLPSTVIGTSGQPASPSLAGLTACQMSTYG